MAPNDEALLQRIATYPEMRRATRERRTKSCLGCFKDDYELGRSLRKCGKCQSALYCSKECQTRDWPAHKERCGDDDAAKLFDKLIKNLVLQSILLGKLHCCCILAFKLLRRSRRDEILFAIVDVAIEPCSLGDFADIFFGQGPSKKPVQGMLQLNAFTPMTLRGPSPERRTLWRNARARADSAGFHDDPMVILDFTYLDAKTATILPSHVHLGMRIVVTQWLERGFALPSGVNGETIRVFNSLIRSDTNDQFRLRTELRPSDIQVLRDAAVDSDHVQAMLLHAKIAREHIYQSIYQEFLQRRKAATGKIPSVPLVKFPCI
ncbi:hypothetical protein C8R45DRAFT_1132851 [Mycena sanguinolenta]|nr:hypothetical protein C8R45DRAFT_1132851 [Mycena sanguinolenta]